MTLILDLPPEVEAHLHERASQHGQKPEEYTLSLLDRWLREDAQEFDAAVAGVRRGMADAAAGREISLEDYLAEIADEAKAVGGQSPGRQTAAREAA